ncbi:MAG TPA: hypothetical protein ENK18_00280, partial [Deltaproteobacteria bacterium]|nr:hypothetical protein [Deltaproteobacteria bacterium]
MPARMDPAAAAHLRRLVRGADGAEVFAVGEIASGWITAVSQTCLRSSGSDPELLDPLRPGQVVVHYAPAGGLEPSAADLALGSRLSEVGVGLVLVDAAVAQQRWVIEPAPCSPQPVDDVALEAFFSEGLPSALDGWEARPEQLQLARRVARCLEEQRPLLCEAGTGTGKSLAYLVPAALWARANESRVVVSTFTRTLQSQLQASDLPLLQAGGLRVRTAVLQGRHNYLCRRRLELLRAEPDPGDEEVVEALWRWSEATEGQTRAELEVPSSAELWEQVRSDADLTLSVGCPHYARCHYYQARRAAASAHVVVVNHALLLLDLSIRAETGRGLLPHYTRLIIDEAHHLADSATSVASERLSAPAVRRALSSLVGTRRRRGILSRLVAADPDARRGRAVAVAPDARRGRAVAVAPDARRGRAVAVA